MVHHPMYRLSRTTRHDTTAPVTPTWDRTLASKSCETVSPRTANHRHVTAATPINTRRPRQPARKALSSRPAQNPSHLAPPAHLTQAPCAHPAHPSHEPRAVFVSGPSAAARRTPSATRASSDVPRVRRATALGVLRSRGVAARHMSRLSRLVGCIGLGEVWQRRGTR
ncbi:hypothetical protein C7974DRAFT_149309 [Boeremia exigua]|uniref:uncharacterized protein n=1 Tax=Boeremia exigua TaxID=749465 RepID=UPI001E8DCCB4|nr:uncharacterized protein C7974DRAFT_149309 [Boeremia exigua]KAH6637859.1 hypothetical protein C7974DRAFT_149309 [Boeremia exigua]